MDIQNNQDERRELRRKRRQKNQLLAYLGLLIFIVVIAVAIMAGIKFVTEKMKAKPAGNELPQSSVEESTEVISSETESEEVPDSSIEETEPEPSVEPEVELTPEEKFDAMLLEEINKMTLEEKVAGLFFISPEALTDVGTVVKAGEGTKAALEQYAVGGIIYSRKNIKSQEQFAEMIQNTKAYSKYPLFLGVAEEGGSNGCLADAKLGTKMDSADKIAETGDPAKALEAGVTIGTYMAALGLNVNFAPVADLATVNNSFMAKRVYGKNAEVAAPFMLAMMQGLESQGVTACMKHFPGVGGVTVDTHSAMIVSERSAAEFRTEEFPMFQSGVDAGVKMIMVGHIAVPTLTDENMPASLTPGLVTGILREELGYDGLIITDVMNVAAISEYYDADTAAVMAVKAGCDMILMPSDFKSAYNGVLNAVKSGSIPEDRINESLVRIYRIKYADRKEQ